MKDEIITFRLSKKLKGDIQRIAASKDRSVGSYLVKVITEAIKNNREGLSNE